jgi:hypothetical protein
VAKSGSGLAPITTSASYDESCSNPVTCNQPNSVTDARGNVTTYTYDPGHGGVETVKGPAVDGVQPQTRYSYTLLNGVHLLTGVSSCRTLASCAGGPDEVKSTIAYDSSGNVVSTSTGSGDGALSATTTMGYDPGGNLVAIDGPLTGADDRSYLRYNGARQIAGTISADPDGAGPLRPRAVRNTYSDGLLTKVEQGNVANQSSDLATFAAAPGAPAVETDYEEARPVETRLVAGSTVHALTQTSYDALGRVDCVAQRMDSNDFGASLPGACALTTPDGAEGPDRIVRTSYDKASRPVTVTTAFGTAELYGQRPGRDAHRRGGQQDDIRL